MSIYPGSHTASTYPSYPMSTSVTTHTTSTLQVDPNMLQTVINNLHHELRTTQDRVAGQERAIQELWGLVTFLAENPGKTVEDWRNYCQVKTKIDNALSQETAYAGGKTY